MSHYRILSLDGGGIRGVVSVVILQRLLAAVPDCLDRVDLYAGTSTGGLLSIGLAKGLTLDELLDFYITDGPKIFDDSWLDNLTDLFGVSGAQYDSKNLERTLRKRIGETTRLRDLRGRVLIPSFDLDNEDAARRTWKPKVFHNFPGNDSDGNQLAYKVGMYTSAAPTYFPTYEGFVDGGVYANNPSMCALAQCQDPRALNPIPAWNTIRLLSIGTGTSLVHVKGKTHDWGLAQWAKNIINIMLDGVSDVARYQCEQMLGDAFHRQAPVFPSGVSIPLDAVNRLPEMIAFASALDLTETIEWVRTQW